MSYSSIVFTVLSLFFALLIVFEELYRKKILFFLVTSFTTSCFVYTETNNILYFILLLLLGVLTSVFLLLASMLIRSGRTEVSKEIPSSSLLKFKFFALPFVLFVMVFFILEKYMTGTSLESIEPFSGFITTIGISMALLIVSFFTFYRIRE